MTAADLPAEEHGDGQTQPQLPGVVWQAEFAGPLPPPQLLQGYEAIFEGAAARIFAMAEEEQRHAHEMQNKELDAEVRSERRGSWQGFAIAVAVILLGWFMAANGEALASAVLVGSGLVALVAVFINGRKTRQTHP